jgi:hypothetical protein
MSSVLPQIVSEPANGVVEWNNVTTKSSVLEFIRVWIFPYHSTKKTLNFLFRDVEFKNLAEEIDSTLYNPT